MPASAQADAVHAHGDDQMELHQPDEDRRRSRLRSTTLIPRGWTERRHRTGTTGRHLAAVKEHQNHQDHAGDDDGDVECERHLFLRVQGCQRWVGSPAVRCDPHNL